MNYNDKTNEELATELDRYNTWLRGDTSLDRVQRSAWLTRSITCWINLRGVTPDEARAAAIALMTEIKAAVQS